MKFKVPFYANTPDNTHCFQACLKMVLKYLFPERAFSWDALRRMTAKKGNLWTWPTAGILAMKKMGFSIIIMEDFDYKRFAKEGGNYLLKKYGEEVGCAQSEHSDIIQERILAGKLTKKITPIKEAPSFKDMSRLMKKGYVIICNVNSRILNKKSGYAGHFVVVTGIDNKSIVIHDPGLPPYPNRKIPRKLFAKAWGYPSPADTGLIAFRFHTAKS